MNITEYPTINIRSWYDISLANEHLLAKLLKNHMENKYTSFGLVLLLKVTNITTVLK